MVLVALAFAHPYVSSGPGKGEPGMGVVGQRLAVVLTPEGVDVHYVAELPAMRVYQEAKAMGAGPTYAADKIEELRGAVRVTWNGVSVPLTRVDVDNPARRGDGDFLEFHLAGHGTLQGEGTLRVSNGNFPDEGCYFDTELSLGPGLVVTDTSLAKVRDGKVRDNKNGAWVRDEAARELTASVRAARPWEDAAGTAPLPQRMAGAMAWPRTAIAAGLTALALGFAGVVGVVLLRRRKG